MLLSFQPQKRDVMGIVVTFTDSQFGTGDIEQAIDPALVPFQRAPWWNPKSHTVPAEVIGMGAVFGVGDAKDVMMGQFKTVFRAEATPHPLPD